MSHGVIAEPHVLVRDLEEHHVCVVLASDGVWDVMSPDEVVEFVMEAASQGKHGGMAAAQLVEHAVALGHASPGAHHDNTSAAVLFI